MMVSSWEEVSIRDIARPVSRPVDVVPGMSYRTIGVKWWGEGAYERQTIDGSQTAAKTLSVVREGDLIINKIWVRHGSTAIVSRNVHGCAASSEFPTFELNLDRVIPDWIHWQTKTRAFWGKCDSLSKGTSGKNRIKPEQFLDIRVPLPPLSEQQRLVARIKELAAKINEAIRLRREAAEESAASLTATLRTIFSECPGAIVSLEHTCSAIIDNLHSNPRYADSGVACVRSPDVGHGTLNLENARRTDEDEYRRRTVRAEPQINDIVFVREGGGTGKCALVRKSQRFSLGQRVMMLRPDPTKVLPRFLLYQLLAPQIQEDQIEPLCKGSASPHLNIAALRTFAIRLPAFAEQSTVVAGLDRFQEQLTNLRQLQRETAVELDAMMPAILDRAFRGEL